MAKATRTGSRTTVRKAGKSKDTAAAGGAATARATKSAPTKSAAAKSAPTKPAATKAAPTKPRAAKPAPTKPAPTRSAPTTAPAVAFMLPITVAAAPHAYAGVKLKPPAYDEQEAKGCLEALRARLDALPEDRLQVPRLDAKAAALAALAGYAFATQVVPLRVRFERLAEIGEFDLANLEDTKAAAFVVILAYGRAEAEGALSSRATVPAALIQEAKAIEKRMQGLSEYKFAKDHEIAPLLALLAPGTSHPDIASDLLGYANIYELRPGEVASDTTNYRPTDVADARRVAGEILSYLAGRMSPAAREAYSLLCRAWTLLLLIYGETQTVGRTLMRADRSCDAQFPSLYAAGGVGRKGKAKTGKGGGDDPPKDK